jgi:hypothetical protein
MKDRASLPDSCSIVVCTTRVTALAHGSPAVPCSTARRRPHLAAAMCRPIGLWTLVIAIAGGMNVERALGADALKRLELGRLQAVHAAIAELQSQRQVFARSGPYRDYRAAIHLHSAFSHDSRGTLAEIVAAAKATETSVLMFTEHTSTDYDPPLNGHHGMCDGVLLIPGLEAKGFLVFPAQTLKGTEDLPPQEYADHVRDKGGLVFLSHVEERMDWEIRGLNGTEIYNTHADFSDEKDLAAKLKNPLGMLEIMERFRKFPQEAFGSLQDYPADYLRKWDDLCKQKPHTGVAAPDSHQNVGLFVRLVDDGKVRLEDALGEKLAELDLRILPALRPLAAGKNPGDAIFTFQLDPYPISLRYVGTHLLMTELSEQAVRGALEAGRAYVSFDWIADGTGFDFAAVSNAGRYEMGSQLEFAQGLQLQARAPLSVTWRLMRNGAVVMEAEGPTLQSPVDQSGNFRVEAWIDVAGEKRLWILSNPIYVLANREQRR